MTTRKRKTSSSSAPAEKKPKLQPFPSRSSTTVPWKPLCQLEEFVSLVKGFPREKKDKLEEMGFGFMLLYNTKTTRKTMCKWVIDHFDPATRTLAAYGDKIVITTRDVEYLLGFSDHGFEIDSSELDNEDVLDKKLWNFTTLKVQGMVAELKRTTHDDPLFIRMFTIFVMTALICPNIDEKPKKAWLHLVIEDDCVRHWNFAKFVLDSLVEAITAYKSQKNPTHMGGCTLLLMGIFCEYSPREGLQNIWKYDLPRIRDWNDVKTKNLHELICKLKDGYFTSKMMGVIDKDKANMVGKAPKPHVEMIERAFDRINDKIDKWGAAVNQMWRLISNFLAEYHPVTSEEDVEEGRRKKGRAKSEEEDEEESSDYDDEEDSGTGDYADSEQEVQPSKKKKVVEEKEEEQEDVNQKKGTVKKKIIFEEGEKEPKKKQKGLKEKEVEIVTVEKKKAKDKAVETEVSTKKTKGKERVSEEKTESEKKEESGEEEEESDEEGGGSEKEVTEDVDSSVKLVISRLSSSVEEPTPEAPKALVAAEGEESTLDVPADGAEEKPSPQAAADAATNEGVHEDPTADVVAPEDPTANVGNASELQPEGGSSTTENKDHETDM